MTILDHLKKQQFLLEESTKIINFLSLDRETAIDQNGPR